VIPLVVFHGSRGWNAPQRVSDLIDLDDSMKQVLRPYLPELSFLLDDLSQQSDESLRARALTQLGALTALSLSRLPHSVDPLAEVVRVLDLMTAVAQAPRGLDALTAVLRYILEVSEPEPGALRQVLEAHGRARGGGTDEHGREVAGARARRGTY
jgi:hypothetical protein